MTLVFYLRGTLLEVVESIIFFTPQYQLYGRIDH